MSWISEKGKSFIGKLELKITKETYSNRNINFRKYVKSLMFGLLNNEEFRTLNLSQNTYEITYLLTIVPKTSVKEPKMILPPYISVKDQEKLMKEQEKLTKIVSQ